MHWMRKRNPTRDAIEGREFAHESSRAESQQLRGGREKRPPHHVLFLHYGFRALLLRLSGESLPIGELEKNIVCEICVQELHTTTAVGKVSSAVLQAPSSRATKVKSSTAVRTAEQGLADRGGLGRETPSIRPKSQTLVLPFFLFSLSLYPRRGTEFWEISFVRFQLLSTPSHQPLLETSDSGLFPWFCLGTPELSGPVLRVTARPS